MKTRRLALSWVYLTVFLLGAAGCRAGTDSNARKLVGGVEVKGGEISGVLPQRQPQTIYVADFTLDADNYTGEEGVRGALSGRLGQRLPHPLASDNPSEKAHQIVETMAESLVQGLGAKGLTAQRIRDIAGNLPLQGWLVQGIFTEVDEGNRLKRAAIGFGRGATSERTVPLFFSADEGADVGVDLGTPATEEHRQHDNRFTGTIRKVTVDLTAGDRKAAGTHEQEERNAALVKWLLE